jgi:ABC-type dipeptide/oligopeptide/nickel transport system permease subunit
MAIAPGMAMSVTVIAVSVLGDGLREHLDPSSTAADELQLFLRRLDV